MNEQDKQLLLKDLCARLPYHPQCYCKWTEKALNGTDGCIQELSTFVIDEIEIMDDPQFKCQICDVKPYLRPMSSMTKEEFQGLHSICPHANFNQTNNPEWIVGISGSDYGRISRVDEISRFMDWLNAHHFDFRGLIEMGLALEAPAGMYEVN